jgi:hypothetical protein
MITRSLIIEKVSYQILLAAVINPLKSMRYE